MSRLRILVTLLLASTLAISGCMSPPSGESEGDEQTEDEEIAEVEEPLKACWGDTSCNEMFESGACPGAAVCYETSSGGVVCVCL